MFSQQVLILAKMSRDLPRLPVPLGQSKTNSILSGKITTFSFI